MRIDVPVLEPLFDAIKDEAKKANLSARRWIALHLAEHFGLTEEEAVPELGEPGRPRRKSRAAQ